jgi:anti-anti-sigma factor
MTATCGCGTKGAFRPPGRNEELRMARLERTQFHKVFIAEQERNVLIVTPRGDSVSFREVDVAGELKTLLDLAGTPGLKHLVVDLSGSDYFGSTMIGAINQLGMQFREAGGKIALCEASKQMLDVLDIMHLGDLWMRFDTRKIALRALSKMDD